jgi:predicted ATPase
LAQQGEPGQGIAMLRSGLASWHRMGARHYLQPFNCLLAEAHMLAGHYQDAEDALHEALKWHQETGEGWWRSRLYRARAELILRRDAHDTDLVEVSLLQALQIACEQGANSLELRAACRLSELWRETGRRAESYKLLAPVVGKFTEGADTAELRHARDLLDLVS